LVRYLSNGNLDPTFGVGGRMTTDFAGRNDEAFAIARQPDGKIIAAGSAAIKRPDGNIRTVSALARYSANASSNSHELESLTFGSHTVAGCLTLPAVVTLCGPAPPGGVQVTLTSTNPAANVPATMTVPEGEISATFDISTMPVNSLKTGIITARFNGVSRRAPLVVRPVGVEKVVLEFQQFPPPSLRTGTVTLECPAPAGGVLVMLSSTQPAAASPTQSQITIPAGSSTGSFTVNVTGAPHRRLVYIKATANGITKLGRIFF
jgi:trimeric autotransporter adhesin